MMSECYNGGIVRNKNYLIRRGTYEMREYTEGGIYTYIYNYTYLVKNINYVCFFRGIRGSHTAKEFWRKLGFVCVWYEKGV